MKLGFVFDVRFVKFKENYYSTNLSVKLLTERYLSVFDEMVVVGRYKEVTESPEGKLVQCNSDRIQFRCIKDESPMKRIWHFGLENRFLKNALKDCDAVICRGWRGTETARRLKKTYLVEVVNCAWDAYWNHGILGKVVAPIMYLIRRVTTYRAPFVIYVTNEFLQRRYPTRGKALGVSDVSLQENSDHVLELRMEKIRSRARQDALILGTAAAVNVPFKGQRFVIQALAKLKKQGISNIEYQMAGGGDQIKLKKLAEKLGVSNQVVFKGSIVHDEMFTWFDSLDVYIQPSLQEGLPRALIEAMSRGLPCYGTRTGGIPELLPAECVCKNNYNIANKLVSFIKEHNDKKASYLARANYEKSKDYAVDLLHARRQAFLEWFARSARGEMNEKIRNAEDQVL